VALNLIIQETNETKQSAPDWTEKERERERRQRKRSGRAIIALPRSL
jgi:hypothetical protein